MAHEKVVATNNYYHIGQLGNTSEGQTQRERERRLAHNEAPDVHMGYMPARRHCPLSEESCSVEGRFPVITAAETVTAAAATTQRASLLSFHPLLAWVAPQLINHPNFPPSFLPPSPPSSAKEPNLPVQKFKLQAPPQSSGLKSSSKK